MDVNTTGTAGANGLTGTAASPNGTTGAAGGTATSAITASTDAANTTEATGGAGGTGGNGYGTGQAGAGGTGGDASAVTTVSTGAPTSSTATAAGGAGGGSGNPGSGPAGKGNSGGAGGAATARAGIVDIGAAVTALATASGGEGGPGAGSGYGSGAGGVASATAYAIGSSATAAATQTGGFGGAGAASTMVDAVSGTAYGGTLKLYQTATGGAGLAGLGGAGSATLIFDDTAHLHTAGTLIGGDTAAGGFGSGTAGQPGASGTAATTLTAAGTVIGFATATGGSQGTDAAGGAASAAAQVTTIGAGSDSADATATATGGTGGYGAGADGGAGGTATGAASAIAANATGSRSLAYADLTGGLGGNGGAGFRGGAGGAASGAAAYAFGANAVARAVQTGGAGGGGGGSGGAGAASTLVNAVSGNVNGTVAGAYLHLYQTARGGRGGSGNLSGGAGGAASSSLAFDDTTKAHQAGQLIATATAAGGDGGGSAAADGAGGDAQASDTLTGGAAVTATATATGGFGVIDASKAAPGGSAAAAAAATSVAGSAAATASATGGAGSVTGTGTADAAALTESGQQATANAAAAGLTVQAGAKATAEGAGVVSAVVAAALASGAGTLTSSGNASIGGAVFGLGGGTAGGFDDATGLPGSVASQLAANSNVNAALGTAKATILGAGTQGGWRTTGASGTAEYVETASYTLNAAGLNGDMIVGFTGDTLSGSGFTSLEFDASVGGKDLLSITAPSVAAAQALFSNDAVDLGAVAATGGLVVGLTLDLITSSANSGFGLSYLFGVTGNGPPVIAAPVAVTAGMGVAAAIPGLAVSESGNTGGETFTVTLSDAAGTLSGSGAGLTGSGSRTLTVSGLLAQVNADLASVMVDEPGAGSNTVTLNAVDNLGGTASAADIALTVNGAPTLTAPASLRMATGQTSAIGTLGLSESGDTSTEIFSVTVTDTVGTLAAFGTTFSNAHTIVLGGLLSQINADLATLTVFEPDGGGDTVTLTAEDGFGNTATPVAIAVMIAGPTISAPGTATIGDGQPATIGGIVITQGDSGISVETVTLSDTGGLLSASGAAGSGTHTITLTGSIAAVNAALTGLTDTNAVAGSDAIVISAADATGTATQTIDVTVNGLPTLTAPASVVIGGGNSVALHGINLAESGDTGSEIFTVTVTDTVGTLSASGVAFANAHTLDLIGPLSRINPDLATLAVTEPNGASDTVTLDAVDGFGNTASPAMIAVTATGVVLTTPGTATIGVGQGATIGGIAIAETQVGATETVTLSDAAGNLSASGAVGNLSHTITLTGSVAAVNAALAGLTDTSPTAGSDAIVVSAADAFGAAAAQTIDVTVNGLPTLSAPASVLSRAGHSVSLRGISLAESGDSSSEKFNVTVTDTSGSLSASGVGFSNPHLIGLVGSLSQINQELATLAVLEPNGGSDIVTLDAADGFGNTAAPAMIVVTATGPALTTPGTATIGVRRPGTIGGISVAETQVGVTETVTLSDAAGYLSASGAVGNFAHTITLTGSVATVNAALAGLTDTGPAAGSDAIVVSVADAFGTAATQTIDVTINGVPTITVPSSAVVVAAAGRVALGSVNLAETGDTGSENFTVTVADTSGTLSASGAAILNAHTIELIGPLSRINQDLATLAVFEPNGGTDTVTLDAVDGFGNTATPASIAVTITGPALTTPGTATIGVGQPGTIGGISVAETQVGATETVTLSDSEGNLSASGAVGNLSHSITLTGSVATVNAALAGLTDTGPAAGSDAIVVSVADAFGTAAAQTIDVTVNGAPTITVPAGLLTISTGLPATIYDVGLSESGNTSGETFTLQLVDTYASLSTSAIAGVSGSGTATLTLAGSLAQINTDLASLAVTDPRDDLETVVLTATDGFGNTARSQIKVNSTGGPVIAAPPTLTLGVGQPGNVGGVGVSETGVYGGSGATTFSVTITDKTGVLSATGAGGNLSHALTIDGSATTVNTALATLRDTEGTAGSTAITLSVVDNHGNAQGNTIAVSVEPNTGSTFVLTTGIDHVADSAGNALIVARPRTLTAGDAIANGGSANVLALQGAGFFDLRAPAMLTGVQIITAQEGQPIYGGPPVVQAANQIVFLRDGLDATVDVLSAAPNPNNPRPATITIYGAHNADLIALGSGNDVVSVGDARETVHGGGGNDLIEVNASTIGATIDGGPGASTLQVSGTGTIAMGSSITRITTALLRPGATGMTFVANAIGGLTIDDAGGAAASTLAAGAAGQTITGGAGHDTFAGFASGSTTFSDTAAAFGGDTIQGFGANGDTIDFTNVSNGANAIESFVGNGGNTAGVLTVTDGTHTASLTLLGSFSAAGFSHATDAGGHGTAITYHNPPA